ncbi:phage virion morphogenesis protein [Candidatus Symbiopectobacterium endolongispinus]|uniref:phage virion morphogenesis protein n=1 Tax=Candidatus Symbiopectobacterium endolongispinus TaxID=2812664 RepID=UPI00207990DB|nr:phage virion morphogenesis protein [Candidatus Symbiopectobacterium endolongispinus]MBT9430945.1 phage virion morphogenesis protein [Candidatus Symbiopectobacterium endolongispinus]
MGGSYEIKYDISDFERGLGELINRLEQRQPLMRELAAAMHDAVEENFAQQGRPARASWSPRYVRTRQGGKILQKRGRLVSSISEYHDNDSATVGTNVVYARIHQEGGTITIPARSQRAYYKQHKDGSVGNRFVKKSKSNFSQWNTIGENKITIPACPFLHLTESDVDGMENTAQNYLQRVIDG